MGFALKRASREARFNAAVQDAVKTVLSDWPWMGPAPPDWLLQTVVGLEQAVGVPALLGVIRLLSGSVSSIPLRIHEGDPDAENIVSLTAPQRRVLCQRNEPGSSAAWMRADIAAALAGMGNAYVRKILVDNGRRVQNLIVLNQNRVKAKRQNGRIVYEDRTEGREPVVRSAEEIIHFRTFANPGELEGMSPITAVRLILSNALKRTMFEGKYFDNDARPGVYATFSETVRREKAEEWLELWNAQHQGASNKWKPAVIGGGAQLQFAPVSMQDAQFVAATKMTASEVVGIYQVPPVFLAAAGGERSASPAPTEEDRLALVTFALAPILTAIDDGFSLDETLFPEGSGFFARHNADVLMRPVMLQRFDAYRLARQGGWITANEIRAAEGREPVEGGDTIQVTPVGGAPNPDDPNAGGAPTGESDTEPGIG